MTREEAIKYLKQLYHNGGHCWLDEQRIEAINMAIEALKEEPASKDLEEAIGQSFIYHESHGDDFRSDKQIETAYRYGFETGAKWGKNQAKVEIQTQSMALAHGCPEEPVSEELEEAAEVHANRCYNEDASAERIAACKYDFKAGAEWQKHQFEKNRLMSCDNQNEEEAKREQDFVFGHVEKNNRIPTFNDAINYGMELQKQNMIGKACRWIEEINNHHYIMRYDDCCEATLNELLEWFKNYMER